MHGHNNQPFVIALVSHTLRIPKEISKILQVIDLDHTTIPLANVSMYFESIIETTHSHWHADSTLINYT
jgi:hypothetical protein